MSTLRGPLLMVASMAGFAVEDALIKDLTARVPVGQVMFLLGVGGALIFAWLAARRGAGLWSMQALRGALLLRNTMEMVAAMAMILAISLVPLSVVSAVLQAMPLAVTLGAALFLGEPVGWRRWSAILVGFVGVLMIVRPGAEGFDPRALLPLFAVFALTARDLATRRIQGSVTSLQVSGWGFLSVIPGGLLLLAIRGDAPMMPQALDWGLLGLTILAGVLAYIALVTATRSGSIAQTTPFRYSRLVFAMLIGVLIFGERPDALTLAGSALVVGAGLYSLMREMRLGKI